MMAVHVTRHACTRYVERINPTLTPAEARATIERSAKAIETAQRFGCRVVIAGRAKLLLDGTRVVTVILRGWPTNTLHREILR